MTPAQFKTARARLGLSQTEMAKKLRLKDARAIRYYEAGGREISGPIQVAIAYYVEIRAVPRGQPGQLDYADSSLMTFGLLQLLSRN